MVTLRAHRSRPHCRAVVALTLIINAPTSAMMYNWLNIYPKNNYRQKLDVQSVANLMECALLF